MLNLIIAATLASTPGPGTPGPVELGQVQWTRSLSGGLHTSRTTGRPVLLLFQEIPGCQGCQDFGTGPLTHPLMVEAIEDLFVPVAINNRGGGTDDAVLARYEEPKLNYPVARFVDADGNDLLPRKDQIFTTGGMAARMIASLESARRPVPTYLQLLAAETTERPLAKATFAMHCYWEGEAKLGRLDGVITTRSGWQGRLEVVDVVFDPSIVPYTTLLQTAHRMECASTVFAHDAAQLDAATALIGDQATMIETPSRDAKLSDRKFALGRTEFRYLPLSPIQSTRVNAALRLGDGPAKFLSPRQRTLLKRVQAVLRTDAEALTGLELDDTSDESLSDRDHRLRSRLSDLEAAASAAATSR